LVFPKRGGSETKTLIESGSIFVEGVGQQGSYAGLFRNPQRTTNGILEESSSYAETLMADRHGKPGEDHDRNRVVSHALPYTPGGIQDSHFPDRQAV